MALPSFFKTYKPKRFNYIPRYYDPQKEELEERIEVFNRLFLPAGCCVKKNSKHRDVK